MTDQKALLESITEASSLPQLQDYVDKIITLRGFADETIQESMLLLLEETGELAKAIRKTATNLSVDADNMQSYGLVENEAADVFIVLLAICNKLKIDLFSALKEKERQNSERNWIKN